MCIVATLPSAGQAEALGICFEAVAAELELECWLRPTDAQRKVLIVVSKFDHCLVDLLYRARIGELSMRTVGIISRLTQSRYK